MVGQGKEGNCLLVAQLLNFGTEKNCGWERKGRDLTWWLLLRPTLVELGGWTCCIALALLPTLGLHC